MGNYRYGAGSPYEGSRRLATGAILAAHSAGADIAEFVALALADAAEILGGPEQLLSHRPGSWEAAGVMTLLAGTMYDADRDVPLGIDDPLDVLDVPAAERIDEVAAAAAAAASGPELGPSFDPDGPGYEVLRREE